LAAIVVFIAIVFGGLWAFNCIGSQGRLEFNENGWFGKYLGFGHGYSTGLMRLQEGQRVMVNFATNFRTDFKGKIYIWVGPVEDYALTWFGEASWRSRSDTHQTTSDTRYRLRHEAQSFSSGNGYMEFIAKKTGIYLIFYEIEKNDLLANLFFSSPVKRGEGDFTIIWQVL
jgi:hypothetical protein